MPDSHLSPSSAAGARRAAWPVGAFFALSWLIGWWMIFDGLHQRLFGDYIRLGGQLGPWAGLVSRLGIEPGSLGMFFIVLGFAFIGASFGVLLRRGWGLNVGLVASAISLLYLGPGMPVALACLALLLLPATRRYLAGDPAAGSVP